MSCPTNCVSASWPWTWFTRKRSLMCILLKSPVRSWTVTSVTRPTSLSGVSVGVSPRSWRLNISGARRLYHTFAFHLSLILRAAARDFFSAIRGARRGVAYLRIGGCGMSRNFEPIVGAPGRAADRLPIEIILVDHFYHNPICVADCRVDAMRAVLKKIDDRGRIVIPAEWRKKWQRGTKAILRIRGEFLEILPQEKVNLTAVFDHAEVDAEADLLNWHAVGRDLRKN